MSLEKFIGKHLDTTEGKLKIKSAKYSGTGCGENMEVIKYVRIKAGDFDLEMGLKQLEEMAL